MARDSPCEPWLSFLTDLESQLVEPTDLHCIGSTALAVLSLLSSTALNARPRILMSWLSVRAMPARRFFSQPGADQNFKKARRIHRLRQRRQLSGGLRGSADRAFPIWTKLRLWALEPHDLALTKLERSNERDVRDVAYLAHAGLINKDTLVARFENELEPWITGRTPTWHRTTLQLWLEECWPGAL